MPFSSNFDAKQFVMFLENFSKAGVVERLIILEENEGEIKFTEGEFEFLAREKRKIK